MKILTPLLFALMFAFPCRGQEAFLAKISLPGQTGGLAVSSSESFWVSSRFGRVYTKPAGAQLWRPGSVVFEGQPFQKTVYENVNFFNDSVLMISGYIGAKDQPNNLILRSTNGGGTWQAVNFGRESMIDAVWTSPGGKAWMSGSSQTMYYSEDFGETWVQRHKIEASSAVRVTSIHFSQNALRGIFGTTWDLIYTTTDGGKTWEKISSPLKQGKYKRIAGELKPEIKKVRVFKDNYIINQEGRTFYANTSDVQWKELIGVVDFEVTEAAQLYAVYKDLTIGLLDDGFKPVYESREKLPEFPAAIVVRNNKFFALADRKIFVVAGGTFIANPMFTDAYPIELPPLRLVADGAEIGFEQNDVLKLDKATGKWFRYFQVPFNIRNAAMYRGRVVITGPALEKHFEVDLAAKVLRPFTLPEHLFDLENNAIKELIVEQGKKVNQYVEVAFKKFVRSGNTLHLEDANSDNFLPNMPDNIHIKPLNDLVLEVDRSKGKLTTISEIQLRQSDITAFKKFINKEEANIRKFGLDPYDFGSFFRFPGENTDFDFYKKVADSVDLLAPEVIGEIFNRITAEAGDTYSWKRITINFANGKQLFIENTAERPNYFYTPWVFSYDGLVFKSGTISISKKINALTLRDFLGGPPLDKHYALFQIADELYRKTLPLSISNDTRNR